MTTTAGWTVPGPQQTVSPSGSMSFGQIEQLWIANGGAPAMAPIMAAIAEAESRGHASEINNTPATGDYSVGLWQINYYGSLLQPRTQAFGPPSALQGDVNAQARAAIQLSNNGTNLAPWRSDPVAGAILAGKPIPTQYTNGAQISPATLAAYVTNTGSGLGSTATPCDPAVYLINLSPFHFINQCQEQEILGGILMGVGAITLLVGLGVVLADVGLRKTAPAIIGAVIGRRSGQRSAQKSSNRRMNEREHAAGLRTQEREHRASIQAQKTENSGLVKRNPIGGGPTGEVPPGDF